MKKIQLTQNKYVLVDDEDYIKLNQYNWHVCKGKSTYYAIRRSCKLKKTIYMHRVIMNPPNNLNIDHINHNGLDNRKENLRMCNQSQNLGNSRISKHNTSGMKGVCWDKRNKKWIVRIKIYGKNKHLGRFKDKNSAKNVYEKAAKQHFGSFYLDGIRKE